MKKYFAPEVEIMNFNAEDVITKSNGLLDLFGVGELFSEGSTSGFLFTNGDLTEVNNMYGE